MGIEIFDHWISRDYSTEISFVMGQNQNLVIKIYGLAPVGSYKVNLMSKELEVNKNQQQVFWYFLRQDLFGASVADLFQRVQQ